MFNVSSSMYWDWGWAERLRLAVKSYQLELDIGGRETCPVFKMAGRIAEFISEQFNW